MSSAENKAKLFIKSLLFHPVIQNLKLVDDKGINVTIHTYDVLKIAEKHVKREFFSEIADKSKKPDVFSLVVGRRLWRGGGWISVVGGSIKKKKKKEKNKAIDSK